MADEENAQACPECGESLEEDDLECPECGAIILGMDDEETSVEEGAVEIEENTTDTPAQLGSLGEMIEMKVLNTVKEREEKMRESMTRSVQEKERRLRERAEEAIERLREKHEKERSDLMDQLEDLRKEKEELRKELETDKRELNSKLEEKQELIEEINKKHKRQTESIRSALEKKKEEEKERLINEKEQLREKLEKEKKELEQQIGSLRDRIEEIQREENQKREELRERHKKEKEELRSRLEAEKEELQEELDSLRKSFMKEQKRAEDRLSQERKHLEERFDEEKEELKERYEKELEEIKQDLVNERESREKEKRELEERYEEEMEDLKDRYEEQKEEFKELLESRIQVGKGEERRQDFRMMEELGEKLKDTVYPFPAIVGQERLKRSLLLNAINPEIKGVLLWGPNGSAKKTAVIGIAELLSDIEAVDEPKVWDDIERYLTGTLITSHANVHYLVDTAMKNGALCTQSIDESADRRVMVVKEASTIDKDMLSYIDSFSLHVKVEPSQDLDRRMEVVRRYKEFNKDPEGFRGKYEDDIHDLRDRIIQTRELLPSVNVRSRQRSTISRICSHNNLPSDMDIAIEEISRTITAYDGRDEVLDEDIQEALDLAQVHRVTGDLMDGM